MRRLVLLGAIAIVTLIVSCTFLVPFDPIGGADAGVQDGGNSSDGALDLSNVCKQDGGAIEAGTYCANHNTNPYPGSPNDLLTCSGGNVTQVVHCASECLFLPAGFPDECNGCEGKATAAYCGRDFPQWDAGTTSVANILIGCRDGQKTGDSTCLGDGGCISGKIDGGVVGPAASCAQ